MSNPIDRDELRRLCDALPGGEWKPVHSNWHYHDILTSDEYTTIEVQAAHPHIRTAEEMDAVRQQYFAFFVAARTALPQLLAELDRVEAERDGTRERAMQLLTARCEVHTGANMSWAHFLISGGDACPVCRTAERTAATDRAEAAETERDDLVSAKHTSVLASERDDYKAGYEAKTVLIHKLVAALTRTRTVVARALTESGHTKFCRAYQDIGDCDCWYGEAWVLVSPDRDSEDEPK